MLNYSVNRLVFLRPVVKEQLLKCEQTTSCSRGSEFKMLHPGKVRLPEYPL